MYRLLIHDFHICMNIKEHKHHTHKSLNFMYFTLVVRKHTLIHINSLNLEEIGSVVSLPSPLPFKMEVMTPLDLYLCLFFIF